MTNKKAVERISLFFDNMSENQKNNLLNRLDELKEDYFDDNVDFDTFLKICLNLILNTKY